MRDLLRQCGVPSFSDTNVRSSVVISQGFQRKTNGAIHNAEVIVSLRMRRRRSCRHVRITVGEKHSYLMHYIAATVHGPCSGSHMRRRKIYFLLNLIY